MFAEFAKAVKLGGGEVHIISSRTDDASVREQTENELRELGIAFDHLFLLPPESACPFAELDWYQKYIWQKLDYCQQHRISLYFDDEEKVLELFRRYGKGICAVKVC